MTMTTLSLTPGTTQAHPKIQTIWLRAQSKHLNSKRLGAMTTSLGSLFQCVTTLSVKNLFLMSSLNLPYCSLTPFPWGPIWLAILAAKAQCWLIFSLLSTATPRSLSVGWLSSVSFYIIISKWQTCSKYKFKILIPTFVLGNLQIPL